MAKYSQELKLMIVQEYKSGAGGYRYLANKYGIAAQWQLKLALSIEQRQP